MKTITGIIAGFFFGFASLAMAGYNLDPDANGSGIDGTTIEGLTADAGSEIMLAQPTGNGGFFGGPNASLRIGNQDGKDENPVVNVAFFCYFMNNCHR